MKQTAEASAFDLGRSIGMTKAAQMMRGKGGRQGVAVDTARRWANPLRGCEVAGQRVVLATVRWCGELLTLPEWVEEFERARTRHAVATPARCVARPERARRAAARQAGEVLDGLGVK